MTTYPRVRRSLAPLLALALAATTAAAAPGRTTIAAARQRPLGTTVTVRGTVTVPSNAFDPGFAVQQAGAGIYVLDSGAAPRALGELVEITGTLTDSFGLLTLQPTAITALGRGPRIPPRHAATASIGEATEGRLFALEGRMVGDVIDDGVFGFKLNIDDGSGPVQIFIYPGTGITTAGLHDGVEIETECFSNQFDTHYECDPANAAHFRIEP